MRDLLPAMARATATSTMAINKPPHQKAGAASNPAARARRVTPTSRFKRAEGGQWTLSGSSSCCRTTAKGQLAIGDDRHLGAVRGVHRERLGSLDEDRFDIGEIRHAEHSQLAGTDASFLR